MSLSEGKMFTIEALNRIDGFVWPDKAKFADSGGWFVFFRLHEPKALRGSFEGGYIDGSLVDTGADHPDWRNSLITREEFESVDGWVRFSGIESPVVSGEFAIDIKYANGTTELNFLAGGYEWDWKGDGLRIVAWRYHKPQKQEVKPEPESIETMIRRYEDAGENKRAAIDKLNQAKADVEQAEALEYGLFMAIEAWAESHGLDIRVLSESEEKPELVITDWRDLQVGDVLIYQSGATMDYIGRECVVDGFDRDSIDRNVRVIIAGKDRFVWPTGWRFIRRPEKK